MDEKYFLNSHKGEKIEDKKPRKHSGSAQKNEAYQMNKYVYLQLYNIMVQLFC